MVVVRLVRRRIAVRGELWFEYRNWRNREF